MDNIKITMNGFKCAIYRDVNGIIKNSLKMPGSRGRISPGGGPKGAKPPGRN